MKQLEAEFPRVVAHRGLSGVYPENTLPSFDAAISLGAEEIEFDLWLSQDAELVVCHDPTVDRTSDGTGRISQLSWSAIQELDAGRWWGSDWAGTPMCRLEDVFAHCGGKAVMNIHLKEPGEDGLAITRIKRMASEHGLAEQIYIAGAPDILEWAVKLAPEVQRCCLHEPLDWQVVDRAVAFACHRVQFWNPKVNEELIEQAHAHGIICNLFQGDRPDTPEEARLMYAAGIDAVLTNYADQVLPVARSFPRYRAGS